MNESCPECGGKVSGCKWDKSNGIDLQTKTNHLDNYLDKNKSWNEFIEWVKIQTRDDNWNGYRDFVKIGLLIEYLKSRCLETKTELVVNDLCVEALEIKVKSLKPVDEVEELAEQLRIESTSYRDYQGTNYWPRLARKAIEIIKGKA